METKQLVLHNLRNWYLIVLLGLLPDTTHAQAPVIVAQPLSRTNIPLTSATFTVHAEGEGPLAYRWLKNSLELTNGVRISGATSSNLTVSVGSALEAGNYSVIVSNHFDATVSDVATLTVTDPYIRQHPTDAAGRLGSTVTLRVTADGTPPAYQWRHEGTNIASATSSAFTRSSLQPWHYGNYDVVISNHYGSTISKQAYLGINLATNDTFAPSVIGETYTVGLQPDGGIVIGGSFSSVAGQSRVRMARFLRACLKMWGINFGS
ncbi:MAG: immunoglobulin domain-containing protein [Verrucomicrobia bacterium]|nr:immunoglobulin domain-containing protein [Verrucomicrobiota bacterium]